MSDNLQPDQSNRDPVSPVAVGCTTAKRPRTIWLIVLPLLCAIAPATGAVLAEWAALATWGSRDFLFLRWVLLSPAVVAILVIPAGAIVLQFRPTNRAALVWLLCAVAYLVGACASGRSANAIRMRAFAELTERSKPLVEAVRSYEAKYGHPPESLQALVPEFIAAVPGTGMPAYPAYRYYTGKAAANYDDNPWVLTVFAPSGIINFDQFMYYPRQNYPSHWGGQRLERIGEWAYVHE